MIELLKVFLGGKISIATLLVSLVVLFFCWIVIKVFGDRIVSVVSSIWDSLSYNYASRCSPSYWQRLVIRSYIDKILCSDLFKLTIPASGDYIVKDLESVFVPLSLKHGSGISDRVEGDAIRDVTHYAAIIGEPGAGKTTLAKSLLLKEIRRPRTKKKTRKFPIYVALKDIHCSGPKNSVVGHISEKLESLEIPHVSEVYDKSRTSQGCLYVLDGLDEVSRVNYEALAADILAFAEATKIASPNNEVYLTVREQFFRSPVFDRQGFRVRFPTVASVVPFTNEDIYRFIRRWDFEDRHSSTYLFRELHLRPQVLDLCRNPLILSMLTAQYGTSHYFEVPDRRSVFYEGVVEELLHRRADYKRIGNAAKAINIARSSFLKEIAVMNLTSSEPRNTFNHADLLVLAAKHASPLSESPEEFIRDTCIDTGLLKEEGADRFSFMHLSFEEYFAACFIAEKRSWDYLRDLYEQTDERLEEVVVFYIGLTRNEHMKHRVLSDLISMNRSSLALRCFLECKYYEDMVLFGAAVSPLTHGLPTILESGFRERSLFDLFAVVFDAKEHVGSVPVAFQNAVVNLINERPDIAKDVLVGLGRFDTTAMLSVYEMIGHEFQDALSASLEELVSDERVLDNVINWLDQDSNPVPKSRLVKILTMGLKFPDIRQRLSDLKISHKDPHDDEVEFVIPNERRDSSVSFVFNRSVRAVLQSPVSKARLDTTEVDFAVSLHEKHPILLRLWNNFFDSSQGVKSETIRALWLISDSSLLVHLLVPLMCIALPVVEIIVVVAFSDPVFGESSIKNSLVESRHLLLTIFLGFGFLGSILMLFVMKSVRATLRLRTLMSSLCQDNNPFTPFRYTSVLTGLWQLRLRYYFRMRLSGFSIIAAIRLFRKIRKLTTVDPLSLSEFWFFDVKDKRIN